MQPPNQDKSCVSPDRILQLICRYGPKNQSLFLLRVDRRDFNCYDPSSSPSNDEAHKHMLPLAMAWAPGTQPQAKEKRHAST